MNHETIIPEKMTDDALIRTFAGCQSGITSSNNIERAVAVVYGYDLYVEIKRRKLEVEVTEATQSAFRDEDSIYKD